VGKYKRASICLLEGKKLCDQTPEIGRGDEKKHEKNELLGEKDNYGDPY